MRLGSEGQRHGEPTGFAGLERAAGLPGEQEFTASRKRDVFGDDQEHVVRLRRRTDVEPEFEVAFFPRAIGGTGRLMGLGECRGGDFRKGDAGDQAGETSVLQDRVVHDV